MNDDNVMDVDNFKAEHIPKEFKKIMQQKYGNKKFVNIKQIIQ